MSPACPCELSRVARWRPVTQGTIGDGMVLLGGASTTGIWGAGGGQHGAVMALLW